MRAQKNSKERQKLIANYSLLVVQMTKCFGA